MGNIFNDDFRDFITALNNQHVEAFKQAELIEIENLSLNLIHYNDLLKTKKSSGRAKDIDDLENLKDLQ